MSKIAFLYPGQGAQKSGMGKDFYENSSLSKQIYDDAAANLDFDVKAMCFEEDERLNLTEFTQSALVATSLAMTEEVVKAGIKPDMTAGLSLGEYCALAAAGAMKPVDAVKLVRVRGKLMQNTCPPGTGAMCAVIGAEVSLIEDVVDPIEGVTIANYNCPGQIVITGVKEAVEEAAEKLKEAGAKRCLMLNVSGPFHSPLMIPAGEALGKELANVELAPLQIPYVTNVTAEMVDDISKPKELLEKQVASPVKWIQSMATMIEAGIDTFIEIGPGKTLAGFMKKMYPDVTFINIGCWEDLEKLDALK